MLSIGQVAKRTNISVRTLRYYDEIDLLKPSFVSESKYRYYSKNDLLHLHQIIVLKELGYTLTKIKSVFKKQGESNENEVWKSSLNVELQHVRKEKEKLTNLEMMISAAINSIELYEEVRVNDILLFIQSIQNNKIEKLHKEHFTNEEMSKMELPDIRKRDPIMDEWLSILKDVHKNKSEPVDSNVSQELAKRILTFVRQQFQDNELVDKYWELLKPEKGDREKAYGMDHDTVTYIENIILWYEKNQGK